MIESFSTPNNHQTITDTKQLKHELYQKLQSDGVLNQVKANVRTQLLKQLTSRHTTTTTTHPSNQFLYRVINTLITEYLITQNYTYTNNIFVTECNNTNNLSHNDIVDHLKLSTIQPIQQLINTNPQSLLYNILQHIHTIYTTRSTDSISTQTEAQSNTTDINELLRHVDTQQSNKYNDIQYQQQLQSILSTEQKQQMEQQVRARLEQTYADKLETYKQVELSSMRLDEQRKYQLQLDNERIKLNELYTSKQHNLQQQTNELHEQLRNKQQQIDTERYDERQKLLFEVQKIQLHELELKQTRVLHEKQAQLDQLQYSEKNRALDNRIAEYENKHKLLDDTINNEKQLLINKHTTEVNTYIDNMKQLENKFNSLQNQYHAQTDTLDDTNTRVTKLLSELSAMTESNGKNESHSKQIQQLNDTLTQQLESMKTKLQYYESIESLMTNNSSGSNHIIRERDTAKQHIIELTEQHKHDIERINAAHQRQIDSLKQQHDALLQQQQSQSISVVYEWKHAHTVLQHDINDLTQQLTHAQQTIDTLQLELKALKRRSVQRSNSVNDLSVINTSTLNTSMLYNNHSNQLNTSCVVRPHTAYNLHNNSILNISQQPQHRHAHTFTDLPIDLIDHELYERQQSHKKLEHNQNQLKSEYQSLPIQKRNNYMKPYESNKFVPSNDKQNADILILDEINDAHNINESIMHVRDTTNVEVKHCDPVTHTKLIENIHVSPVASNDSVTHSTESTHAAEPTTINTATTESKPQPPSPAKLEHVQKLAKQKKQSSSPSSPSKSASPIKHTVRSSTIETDKQLKRRQAREQREQAELAAKQAEQQRILDELHQRELIEAQYLLQQQQSESNTVIQSVDSVNNDIVDEQIELDVSYDRMFPGDAADELQCIANPNLNDNTNNDGDDDDEVTDNDMKRFVDAAKQRAAAAKQPQAIQSNNVDKDTSVDYLDDEFASIEEASIDVGF